MRAPSSCSVFGFGPLWVSGKGSSIESLEFGPEVWDSNFLELRAVWGLRLAGLSHLHLAARMPTLEPNTVESTGQISKKVEPGALEGSRFQLLGFGWA